ncbi:MAG: hypothetical protein ISS78_02395 [Phycisphaerae bacterium]|nr:hypothetical protein [Phycisphaerae bacterium]
MKQALVFVAAAGMMLFWLGGSTCGQEVTESLAEAAGQPTSRPQRSMAELIKSISSAPDAATAGRDYAEALKIDAKNAELLEAYMRRLWHFDRYQIAYYPALQLTKKDPTNGQAWGIVGYFHAMRGNYLRALEPTLQAAKCMPDDAATMANAGSLVAWYERTKPQPKISQELKNLIEISRMGWSRTKQFSEAHASYGKKSDDAKQKIDKVVSAEKAKIEPLTREFRKLDEEYRKQYRQASDRARDRRKLLNQLADVERKLKSNDTADLRKQRDNLRKRIRDANKNIRVFQRRLNYLRSKGSKVRKDMDAAKKAIKKLSAGSAFARLKFDCRSPGKDGKAAATGPKGRKKKK